MFLPVSSSSKLIERGLFQYFHMFCSLFWNQSMNTGGLSCRTTAFRLIFWILRIVIYFSVRASLEWVKRFIINNRPMNWFLTVNSSGKCYDKLRTKHNQILFVSQEKNLFWRHSIRKKAHNKSISFKNKDYGGEPRQLSNNCCANLYSNIYEFFFSSIFNLTS